MRIAVAVASLLLLGCATTEVMFSGASDLRIVSETEGVKLAPPVVTSVYRYIDRNTIDVYISDMEPQALIERLMAGGQEPANVLHIHMFLLPRAGQTPIDFTASNSTLTHVILSGDALGVYGGGGFFLPSGDPGAGSIGGVIRDATLRLTASSTGFADRLGSCELSGRVNAERDDELGERLASALSFRLTAVGARAR